MINSARTFRPWWFQSPGPNLQRWKAANKRVQVDVWPVKGIRSHMLAGAEALLCFPACLTYFQRPDKLRRYETPLYVWPGPHPGEGEEERPVSEQVIRSQCHTWLKGQIHAREAFVFNACEELLTNTPWPSYFPPSNSTFTYFPFISFSRWGETISQNAERQRGAGGAGWGCGECLGGVGGRLFPEIGLAATLHLHCGDRGFSLARLKTTHQVNITVEHKELNGESGVIKKKKKENRK